MMRSLAKILKRDKEQFVVPRTVQDVIPAKRIWTDGIWLVGNKYSKCWKFSDINYATASRSDKKAMFLSYEDLLNSLDSSATTKITISNKRMNKQEFEESILLPMRGDRYDEYRKEYNDTLLSKVTEVSNSIIQERYITVSVSARDIEEARSYFIRTNAELSAYFAKLSSSCTELNSVERLRIFHDFIDISRARQRIRTTAFRIKAAPPQ